MVDSMIWRRSSGGREESISEYETEGEDGEGEKKKSEGLESAYTFKSASVECPLRGRFPGIQFGIKEKESAHLYLR